MITIAHRLNTIIKSDKVLVLSHGEIAEYDTPQSLMADPQSKFSELLKELKKKKQEEANFD
jgi:ABC-type multidrug transport system fused ATPase/permease subunit